MIDFKLTMKTILKMFQDIGISIENHVTVKVINFLDPKLKTYITVLNKKTHNKILLLN